MPPAIRMVIIIIIIVIALGTILMDIILVVTFKAQRHMNNTNHPSEEPLAIQERAATFIPGYVIMGKVDLVCRLAPYTCQPKDVHTLPQVVWKALPPSFDSLSIHCGHRKSFENHCHDVIRCRQTI